MWTFSNTFFLELQNFSCFFYEFQAQVINIKQIRIWLNTHVVVLKFIYSVCLLYIFDIVNELYKLKTKVGLWNIIAVCHVHERQTIIMSLHNN